MRIDLTAIESELERELRGQPLLNEMCRRLCMTQRNTVGSVLSRCIFVCILANHSRPHTFSVAARNSLRHACRWIFPLEVLGTLPAFTRTIVWAVTSCSAAIACLIVRRTNAAYCSGCSFSVAPGAIASA